MLYRSTHDDDDIKELLVVLISYVPDYFINKWNLRERVGAVVPVEPDYEAAANEVRANNPKLVAAHEIARRAVDAALQPKGTP